MKKSTARHGLLVLALALVAGCRRTPDAAPAPTTQATAAATDSDAQPATQPAPAPPELVAIELFGTRQVTQAQLLAAMEVPLRAFAADVMAQRPAMELGIPDELERLGDFAYARPALVGYYEPGGMKYYLTVDFVDRADAGRRMPFLPEPDGAYADPEGLLADWRTYEQKFFELTSSGAISPQRHDCPAFHCLGDDTHPELAPLAARFGALVPAHVDELELILRDDADSGQRAAAAYLLAFAGDGPRLVAALLGALRDGDDLVRNNAMRVIAEIAFHHPALDVPVEPVLDALEYPATLDRNKASAVLSGLLDRPDGARLHAAIARRALPTLRAMLRLAQPNNHDFAYKILQAISGQRFGEHDFAAWDAWTPAP